METTKDYFESIIGKCFHYELPNGLEYPHGKMKAIVVAEYREDMPYGPMVICYISFTDGYMGSYSYRAGNMLKSFFQDLIPF